MYGWDVQGCFRTYPERTFHTPEMTVAFKLHPEFCRRDTDEGADKDFEKVIMDLAKASGTSSVTKMKLQYEEMRIDRKSGSHNLHSDMNDRESGAFHGVYVM